MKHKISDDRSQLTIYVTPEEQAELRELEEIQSDKAMADFLEPLTCNSELEWTGADESGDLTSAPMLGIYERIEIKTKNAEGFTTALKERWAFMDYQVRSVLEDLRDKGECIFVGGEL